VHPTLVLTTNNKYAKLIFRNKYLILAYKLKVTKLFAQSQTNANVHKKNGLRKLAM
jgi:hypothetical protein